ncbi:hypothetical protein FKZ61_002040 [Litorilinea aerophila]|uniref:MTAP family purine nucleoside phosphorylase n=1 Tax=Litorilinea aerophila TaxID=1204385 RepID=A0A540VLN5_9CHLR|nr:MTAP family purine nucleoside phosphorylase [Litorilinea aerophila]MCC9074896.1 hypothetical protein [Litorilinea aerophila]
MTKANLLLLLAVPLPPMALDILGELQAEQTLQTPYGAFGPLALRAPAEGPAVWVQPYTGLPSRTDPRAAIYACRALGVQRILAWDMAVALNPLLRRGAPAIVTDYIDFTSQLPTTFYETEVAPEVDPEQVAQRPAFCPEMTAALRQVLPGVPEVVYLGVDGPRRETPAEARMFRLWGADVIGQNMVPEVSLAQEMELCFAGLVTVASTGADRPPAEPHGEVRASLGVIADLLPTLASLLAPPYACQCASTPA